MTPPLPTNDRTKQFNLRLSVEEVHEVKELADALGITASDFIRHLVLRELKTVAKMTEKPERERAMLAEGRRRHIELQTLDAERRFDAPASPPTKKTKR